MEHNTQPEPRKRAFKTLIKQQPQLYTGPGPVCKKVCQTACQAIADSGQKTTPADTHGNISVHSRFSDPHTLLGQ